MLKNEIKERKTWSLTGSFRLGEAFGYRRNNKMASVCRGLSLPGFQTPVLLQTLGSGYKVNAKSSEFNAETSLRIIIF